MNFNFSFRNPAFASVLTAIVIMTGCDGGKQNQDTGKAGPKPPLVEYVTPQVMGASYGVYGNGFLQASNQIAVVSELPGVVEKVSPQLITGGRFDEGEMLFQLEQRTFAAEKKRAQAALRSAQSARANAQTQLDRLRALEDDNLVSEAQRDQARVALSSAKAQEHDAEAALTLADERLDDTTVRAPFNAQVIEESLSQGAFVNPGQKIATIFDTSFAEVLVGLSENDAGAVMRYMDKEGGKDKVAVEIRSEDVKDNQADAGKNSALIKGQILSVVPALDERARTVNFLVGIPQPFEDPSTPDFLLGDYVSVRFPAAAEGEIYSVPQGVIRREQYLYLVDENNSLQRLPVSVLARENNKVLFLSDDKRLNANSKLLLTSLAEEAQDLKVRPQAANTKNDTDDDEGKSKNNAQGDQGE